MKILNTFCLTAAIAFAGSGFAQNLKADGTPAVPGYDSYGAVISPENSMSNAAFTQFIGGKKEADVKLETEIITSCKKKGCWMDVKLSDGSTMKVTFTDYGFFVPTDGLNGKTAVLQGHASREVVTEAMRRHYAEDAGKSKEECEAIKGDENKLSFVADGVLIKK